MRARVCAHAHTHYFSHSFFESKLQMSWPFSPNLLRKKRYSLIQPQCHYQKFWLFNIDAKLLLNSLYSNFTNCLDIFYYNNFCSSNPGSHITFIFHVSLVSLNWRQFLQPFIVSHGADGFVFWGFFYEYRVIVDRMSLIWVSFFFSFFFFICPHGLIQVTHFGQKYYVSEVVSFSLSVFTSFFESESW